MYLVLSRMFKHGKLYQQLVQVLENQFKRLISCYDMKKKSDISSLTCLEVIQVFSRALLILSCLKLLFSRLLKVVHINVKIFNEDEEGMKVYVESR